jgi:hypothetical protein
MYRIITIVTAVVLTVIAVLGIHYIRRPALYMETTDMDEKFLEGFEEVRDALNFRLIKDDPDPNCASATVVTAQSIECGDKLITYGPRASGVFHVDADTRTLLRRALDVAYARKAARIAVVQLASADAIAVDAKAYVPITTTPERVLEDIFRTSQNRVLDAFVIMDPSLMFDRRKVSNSKLVIACGFKNDGADIVVDFDPKEQGYMAGVLAYNIHKGRRLFKDKNIFTKIYVSDTTTTKK